MTGGHPLDDYTPFGYLNLPGHVARLNQRGVMRSNGVGFGWHFPSLASYGGRTERYRAGFALGGNGHAGLSAFDQVRCPYHTGHVTEFHATTDEQTLTCQFFMLGDDMLCARLGMPLATGTTVHLWYERTVGWAGEWGESGLVARTVGDAVVLQSFEDGDAFTFAAYGADVAVDLGGQAPVTVLGQQGERVAQSATVELAPVDGSVDPVWLAMARGRTADEALGRLPDIAALTSCLDEQLELDHRFWAAAPVLSGDWPAHWRRGLVYDQETLRMMIKQPVGGYGQIWDAMQIQAPRTVLGEAAMDAVALSWADPRTAAELLYGTFANAAMPSVPCSREDGTYNMVSAQGEVCGTGPQWGFPFLATQIIAARLGDDAWLARLYPYLAGYLRWWCDQRRRNGWFVHACSWESGQDLSPRFGDQPLGGGHPTWQLAPVDLHAAVSHAANVLADVAERVSPDEAAGWRALAAETAMRTRSMWTRARFADLDLPTHASTDVDDVMLTSPVALGVASAEQTAALEPALRGLDPDTLVWPMFVWTPVLAATRAGRPDIAAELAAAVIDRAYRHWDRREDDGSHTLPGIACEYWPLSGKCGGEGYGWGAFTTELLLSTIVGLEIGDDAVRMRPMLPVPLRRPGTRYQVRLTLRGQRRTLELAPDVEGVTVTGLGPSARLQWGEQLTRTWTQL